MAIDWIDAQTPPETDDLTSYLVVCDGELFEAIYRKGLWMTDRSFADNPSHWAKINWPDGMYT